TDRPIPAEFERRLVDELARHAAVAHDPRPTRVVAAEAMRLGRRRPWALAWRRGRPLMVAAVLLVPMALALGLAGAQHSSPAPAGDFSAVVARPAGSAVDVVLVDVDGRERLLRQLTPEDLGLGPDHTFESGGNVSPSGWLEV